MDNFERIYKSAQLLRESSEGDWLGELADWWKETEVTSIPDNTGKIFTKFVNIYTGYSEKYSRPSDFADMAEYLVTWAWSEGVFQDNLYPSIPGDVRRVEDILNWVDHDSSEIPFDEIKEYYGIE